LEFMQKMHKNYRIDATTARNQQMVLLGK